MRCLVVYWPKRTSPSDVVLCGKGCPWPSCHLASWAHSPRPAPYRAQSCRSRSVPWVATFLPTPDEPTVGPRFRRHRFRRPHRPHRPIHPIQPRTNRRRSGIRIQAAGSISAGGWGPSGPPTCLPMAGSKSIPVRTSASDPTRPDRHPLVPARSRDEPV